MITENMSDNKMRYISYLRREPKSNKFTRNINMCVPDKFFHKVWEWERDLDQKSRARRNGKQSSS